MVTVRNSDSHFENPEPGSYPATCYKIIDLGTQEGEYQGKTIKRRLNIVTGKQIGRASCRERVYVLV